ncbi:MAG: FkbM family methyltransferase [Streptococcus sp.]|nr:FkbM family methyltransferase [Streptococcus sp.]
MTEKEKVWLRQKVMTLPITPDYPFDPEAKLLRCIGIKPTMLDIGANTGIYSEILEDVVGSDNLYIFEPLPHLYKHLKQKFKRSHVFDWAISDHEDTQNIRVPYIGGERFDTRASLNKHSEPDETSYEEIAVHLSTLDNVIKKLGLQSIGFIKIDVEGHELEVLNGGVETLTRFNPLVLIEIETRHHQYPITKIFSKFEDISYKGYYINPETYMLLKTNQFDSNRDQNQEYLKSRHFIRYLNNFFFVHESFEKEFVLKVLTFLESEKQYVKQGASADTHTSCY